MASHIVLMTSLILFLLVGCRPSVAVINEGDIPTYCAHGAMQADVAVHAESPQSISPPNRNRNRKLGSSGTSYHTLSGRSICYTQFRDVCDECVSKAAHKLSIDCAEVGGLGTAYLPAFCYVENY